MKQTINFSKFHGLGNDFILIDGFNQRLDVDLLKKETPLLCDRRFGVGADGLIIISPAQDYDAEMTVFNSDGSEPEMCGNGLRCLARFAYEKKLIEKDIFSIKTKAGVMIPALIKNEGDVVAVEVDMGVPQSDHEIQLKETAVSKERIDVEGDSLEMIIVSMGNPHAVIIVDDLDQDRLKKIGEAFQTHDRFPNGVNVEFVQIQDRQNIEVQVWERGAGFTLACGTGACAAVVALAFFDKADRKVRVSLPGGALMVEWQESDNHVIKTGPAQKVFDGELCL